MLNHPDYMAFDMKKGIDEYPIKIYTDFLRYVKATFKGQYWHGLPKDVAFFGKEQMINAKNTVDE